MSQRFKMGKGGTFVKKSFFNERWWGLVLRNLHIKLTGRFAGVDCTTVLDQRLEIKIAK